MKAILAIDQGTTSTRALIVDEAAQVRVTSQVELPQYYPQSGWVEHDAEIIWRDTLATARGAIDRAKALGLDVAAIGITNQRETFLLWDRETGTPLHRAIVWQDRRGADLCRAMAADGLEPEISERTGLLLDSYFSATKLAWLLDAVPDARALAGQGRIAFGTIDSFLLWRLTGGAVHATDPTNASRTLLFDIRAMAWCPDLCRMFGVPMQILPEVRPNDAFFGTSDPSLLGRALPITGMAGDQQAALIGQRCLRAGDAKITYGTGGFALMNTGETICRSAHRLLATVGFQAEGRTCYALEGAIFVAGAAIQWLRDSLGVVAHAGDSEAIARSLTDNGGVYFVPAFVGLGSPHWDADARGLITGLSLGATSAHLVRAALEAVAYQSRELVDTMARDSGLAASMMRVDGGMTANGWLCQFLADMLGLPVHRPAGIETTALGAAFLAGVGAGLWSGLDAIPTDGKDEARFAPSMGEAERTRLFGQWADAVDRARSTSRVAK
ncbi:MULTISPECIES: glycerol kinase GlpK [unclassified Sphingobium]|uniref:glycerol kinase GlpK n=1 Tax=unclassified Sphingobium TaxID=2611147 RepID=UPI0035A5C496